MYVWSGKQILKYRFGSFACPLAALHVRAWGEPSSGNFDGGKFRRERFTCARVG